MGQPKWGLLLALPSSAVVILFAFIPALASFWISFTDWRGLASPSWVGLENYQTLLQDERFWRYARQTALYAAMSVPLSALLALVLALAIHHVGGAWASFFRLVFYLPLVSGLIASALLLQALMGLFPQNPLARVETVLPALAVFSTWQGVGSWTLLYLAALARLPRELYEAAALDGASGWAMFLHLTLPQISPVVALVLVLSLLSAVQAFEVVLFLTRGGPGDASTTVALYIYTQAFRYFRMGYAAALAWSVALVLFLLLSLQRRLERGVHAD